MYITYKTVCKITGKYYIGSHKQESDDEYLGSGKELRNSIDLYGVENHYRETIAVFDTREESVELEHQLVRYYKKNDPDNIMNKNVGGQSFDYVNKSGKNLYPITEENMKLRCENLTRGRETQRIKFSDDTYRKHYTEECSKRAKKYFETHCGHFTGKQHRESTKEKISTQLKGKGNGSNNSQYGSFWITDGNTNKKWRQSNGDLPDGFRKGRVMKQE